MKIVRHYMNRYPNHRTIDTGLTMEEAQAHCRNPETSSSRSCSDPCHGSLVRWIRRGKEIRAGALTAR